MIGHAEKIKITKEHSLDVELAFAGHKNGTVKRIYSHFAPLEHNARWLRSNHPHAEQISCASTAHAALKARADEHGAAITSRAAATIYGLDVLAFPLGADEENVTRFMQIALADGKAHHGKKTGLVLALKDTPGSLAKFLQPFERANLNLSAIVSRAVHGKPGSHRFFIEVDGSETETKISSAVEQAEASAISLVSLGNYSATAKLKG